MPTKSEAIDEMIAQTPDWRGAMLAFTERSKLADPRNLFNARLDSKSRAVVTNLGRSVARA